MEHVEHSLGAFLVNSFGDRYLHTVNRNAFNAIGSDALYRSMHGDAMSAEYQFNLIIGTDSGILLKFILKHGVAVGSRYLFVELPEVLDAISREGLLEDLPEEIRVVTLAEWVEQANEWQMTNYIHLDAVVLQGSLASTDANLPEYRELAWVLGIELEATVHRVQSSTNWSQFILRQIENLPENRLGFTQTLAGTFAGRTAIILAGGPSLQEALPWVKENMDRVVVIAVSRISRILLDQGIVPHIIVTVDPQQISFEVSREMLLFADALQQPLLVQSHHASPLLLGQWPGRSVYTSSLFPWRTPLNQETLTYSGPTVGNFSLSLAVHMGCTDIILAGVDLCFSPKGQTHAAGSNENKVGPNLGQISPRLETYGGWHADTNQGYAAALKVLANQAENARDLGLRVYNCSSSAAKVELIDFLPLAEMTLPAVETSPYQIITQRVHEPSRQARLSHYRLVYKELSRARRKFQEILKLSREALDCADGLFGTNGRKRDFHHKIRMDKIERRLGQSFGDFSVLIRQVGIKRFLTILKTPKQAEEWTDEQIEKATRNYYQSYVQGAEYFIGLMDGALLRIESRMEEEKDQPRFDRLFSQWKKDRQCGRLQIWRQNHADRVWLMSVDDLDKARWLEQEFQRTMTEEQTSQMKVLEKGHDVKHTRSKALLLFARREIDQLERMVQALSEHPNPEKALPYLHFVTGLVAELRGETEQAVACYQNLLEESCPLTEDALQQIAAIALSGHDEDNALLALECLAGLSPAYLPPYADLLKVLGRFEDAFNSYNHYLGLVPDDASAMLRLGLLCTEAGLTEAARELFHRVLALDARNSAAHNLIADLEALGQSSPRV